MHTAEGGGQAQCGRGTRVRSAALHLWGHAGAMSHEGSCLGSLWEPLPTAEVCLAPPDTLPTQAFCPVWLFNLFNLSAEEAVAGGVSLGQCRVEQKDLIPHLTLTLPGLRPAALAATEPAEPPP